MSDNTTCLVIFLVVFLGPLLTGVVLTWIAAKYRGRR